MPLLGCWLLLSAGATAQPVLQSEFLKNDPVAVAVVSGSLMKDVNEVGAIAGVTQADTTTFAYRIVSAYKQIGYCFPYGLASGDRPQEIIQNRFQAQHALPMTSTIDARLLLSLDALLAVREQTDKVKSVSFPLLPKIPPPPLNEPPATHLAAVYQTVLSALPAALAPWTEDNLHLYFSYQRSGSILTLPGGDYRLCDGFYYSELGDSCTVVGSSVWVWSDDFSLGATTLHEYAHFLDGALYMPAVGSAVGSVPTAGFSDIGYDSSDRIVVNGWTLYRVRSTTQADRISDYALGWYSSDHPGYYTAFEDFAESFTAYVLEGVVFRDLARANTLLASRYDWLKQHVFGGVEFDTGNRGYATFFPSGSRPLNVIDYSRADPGFAWGGQVAILGAAASFYPVSPCRIVDTRIDLGLSGTLPAGSSRQIRVTDSCGIPSTATAVSINVVAVDPTGTGGYSVFPGNGPVPDAAAVAFKTGRTRAGSAIVGLLDGVLTIANSQQIGSAHLVVDTNGYFR